MKIGDEVRVKQSPETEGEIIDMRYQFPRPPYKNGKWEWLVHVDEGIDDYWYFTSELEVIE